MESNKIVETFLKKKDDKIYLEFSLQENVAIELTNNDSNEIKKVFLELIKKLREGPLQINLSIDTSIDHSCDGLFVDVSKSYVTQLNRDLKDLEEDSSLKKVRENFLENQ